MNELKWTASMKDTLDFTADYHGQRDIRLGEDEKTAILAAIRRIDELEALCRALVETGIGGNVGHEAWDSNVAKAEKLLNGVP